MYRRSLQEIERHQRRLELEHGELMSRVQYLAEEVSLLPGIKKKEAQCVLDHNGKAAGHRSVMHNGRSAGFHGPDARISWREHGSCPFTPAVKAEQNDKFEWDWGIDT